MMNYFVEIRNFIVIQSMVLSSLDCGDLPFPESEAIGQAFIASLGITGEWIQTSNSGKFRGGYAGIGYGYDPITDKFVAPEIETI
jgi:hypothetical protein